MKKSILLVFCLACIVFTQIHAQTLQKTEWKSSFAAPINDTATLTFNQDTSIITTSQHMELVRSIFHIYHDTVTIKDIEGPIACGDEEGMYTFTNSGNILKLKLISDPCDGRANSLSGREWVRVKH